MKREPIPTTDLYVRNFGRGRSRITLIEPRDITGEYDPVRIEKCSVILFNSSVRNELRRFYMSSVSRAQRNELIPGGVGSTADLAIKKFVL